MVEPGKLGFNSDQRATIGVSMKPLGKHCFASADKFLATANMDKK